MKGMLPPSPNRGRLLHSRCSSTSTKPSPTRSARTRMSSRIALAGDGHTFTPTRCRLTWLSSRLAPVDPVRRGHVLSKGGPMISTILVGVDEDDSDAMRWACERAAELGADVVVVLVVRPITEFLLTLPPLPAQLVPRMEETLERDWCQPLRAAASPIAVVSSKTIQLMDSSLLRNGRGRTCWCSAHGAEAIWRIGSLVPSRTRSHTGPTVLL